MVFLRFDCYFKHTVEPIAEDFVSLLYFIKRHGMREQRSHTASSSPAALHRTALSFLPPRTEGSDDSVIAQARREGFIRHLEFARVDPQARQCFPRSKASQRRTQTFVRAPR